MNSYCLQNNTQTPSHCIQGSSWTSHYLPSNFHINPVIKVQNPRSHPCISFPLITVLRFYSPLFNPPANFVDSALKTCLKLSTSFHVHAFNSNPSQCH